MYMSLIQELFATSRVLSRKLLSETKIYRLFLLVFFSLSFVGVFIYHQGCFKVMSFLWREVIPIIS